MVRAMEARSLARQLAVSRIALGAGLAVAPALAARGWIGDASATPGAQALARGFGMRDVAIGTGALVALQRGGDARHWLLAGAASDFADLVATVIAREALPPLGRYGVAALAATGASLSLWAAAQAP